MTHFAACQSYDDQIQAAIRTQAIRCLEKMAEEEGMISSSGDLIRQMWSIWESQTSSALGWVRRCCPARSLRPDVHILENDYGLISASESFTGVGPCSENLDIEISIGPPEHEWKPLKTKLVLFQQSSLDIEP